MTCLTRAAICQHGAVLLIAAMLAGCGGPRHGAAPASPQDAAAAVPRTPQIPPVQFGKRPPNTPMTSANMPYFDIVKYCEFATRGQDSIPRGPAYEVCAENESHYRNIIGDAINAKQYKDKKVDQCATASRSAYQGMWFCMNDQPFS